ncbi:MAG TPA: efflux RND transporter periplasmic adaptor subunit [Gammaproteobacteria bacterium]|jgi:multidrug efflux system membrane fusion protein
MEKRTTAGDPAISAARWVYIAVLAMALAACGGGDAGEDPGMQMPPTAVSVAKVVDRPVTTWDEFTGRIEAVDTVEIRPRVAGYLETVHFEEGGIVEKGALLCTIDRREYQAAVAVARANLERADTRITLAEQEVERSEMLIEARAISREEFDQRRNELQQAQADRNGARAQLEQAELNLSFAQITAPITGRIGAALVKPGNLVAPGETLLTTLVSVDPVYATFEADESVYLEARNGSGRFSGNGARTRVQVGLASDSGFPYEGELDFVDNRVDPETGTIRARAVLPNPDGMLTPGLFARVRLLQGEQQDALLIHDMAVLTDQDRKYVYVVGASDLAERRDVQLGSLVDGLRIVTSGLTADDRVVVNGVRRIFFPGVPLAPAEVPMSDPLAAVSSPQGAAEGPAAN